MSAAATSCPWTWWERVDGRGSAWLGGKATHLARVDLLAAESVVVGPHVDGCAMMRYPWSRCVVSSRCRRRPGSARIWVSGRLCGGGTSARLLIGSASALLSRSLGRRSSTSPLLHQRRSLLVKWMQISLFLGNCAMYGRSVPEESLSSLSGLPAVAANHICIFYYFPHVQTPLCACPGCLRDYCLAGNKAHLSSIPSPSSDSLTFPPSLTKCHLPSIKDYRTCQTSSSCLLHVTASLVLQPLFDMPVRFEIKPAFKAEPGPSRLA